MPKAAKPTMRRIAWCRSIRCKTETAAADRTKYANRWSASLTAWKAANPPPVQSLKTMTPMTKRPKWYFLAR